MKTTKWSPSWNASKDPTKQRVYVKAAPLHIKSAMMMSLLSKDLRKKLGVRSARVRVGDTVKILRGQYKLTGHVEKVLSKRQRLFIENASRARKDGTKAFYPIHPSNVMITEFGKTGKHRFTKSVESAPKADSTKQENSK